MYGQLYHRTISRELRELAAEPRAARAVGRGGRARAGADGSMGGRGPAGSGLGLRWRGAGVRLARGHGQRKGGGATGPGREDEMTETRACGKRTRPELQGAKPVRPVRGPATRDEVPRKVGQRWQHLRAMHDFRALDAKGGALMARFARHASRIARLRLEMDA